MFLLLTEWLKNSLSLHIPAAFSFYSTRMMLSFVTSLIVVWCAGPSLIRLLVRLKIGQHIRIEESETLANLHKKKENTPTMGGVLILTALLVSSLLWMDIYHCYTAILLLVLLVLGGTGGYDDFLKLKYRNSKGLSARYKFLFQLAVALLVALYLLVPQIQEFFFQSFSIVPPHIVEKGVAFPEHNPFSFFTLYVPFFKYPLLISLSSITIALVGLFYFCVIAGSSNAVNLTDGLDGLAAGCLTLVAASLALIAFVSNHHVVAAYLNIAYIEGGGEIAIFLSALVGATLGFLWYNCHPAEVFMGDTGSLSLGGLIGVASILLKKELLLVIIGGIFVVEALSVILQVLSYRFRGKKRLFLCTPIHHHFEFLGWKETKIVVRFWIIGALLAVLGLVSLKLQ